MHTPLQLISAALTALLGALTLTPAEAAVIYDKDGTALEMFGRIQALGLNRHAAYRHEDSNNSAYHTIDTDARLGIAARSKIADHLDAVAMAEWQAPTESGDDFKCRYMWVGIDAYQYGTLMAGKGDGAFYTVAGATDIFNHIESRASDYFASGDHPQGQLMYVLSSLGWDIRLSFQSAKTHIDGTPYSVRNAAAFAVSTKFAHDVTFSYGVNYMDLTYPDTALTTHLTPLYAHARGSTQDEAFAYLNNHHPGHKYDLGAALSYGVLGDGLYVSLLYTATVYQHLPHRLYTYEAVADYAFDCGLGLKGGVSFQTYDGARKISDLDLGIYYKFSPACQIFAEAQIDTGSHPERYYTADYIKEKQLGEDLYVVGMEYTF